MLKRTISILWIFIIYHSAYAGWVIVQKSTDPKGVVTNETIYIQKNVLKQVSKNLTIIFDINQTFSTVFQMHFNACGTRIKRIFNQFLDDRGWTFDHFPCGDLRGDFWCQQTDGHRSIITRLSYNSSG